MPVICRPWITLRNGKRLYAKDCGKVAFCFEVDEIHPKKEPVADTTDSTTE